MHSAVFEAGCDDGLAAAFEDAGGDTQALGAEGGVAHLIAVVVEVVEGFSGFVAGVGVLPEGGEELVEAALVEFVAAPLAPLLGEVGSGSEEGLGGLEEVSLGVEDVHDLEGVGEVFVGEVPDPGGAVTEDDPARGVEGASAFEFAEHAFGEGRGFGIGVVDGDGLDGGVVGDVVRVAGGVAVLVVGFGGPDDGELGPAGLGGAVGLFALLPLVSSLRTGTPVPSSPR